MNSKYYQQGDVILRPCKIPADAKEVNRRIVMEGEGHHVHTLDDTTDVEVYERDGVLYLRVLTDTPLRHLTTGGSHGEHNTESIAPGEYVVEQVHEWDPWANEARPVVD